MAILKAWNRFAWGYQHQADQTTLVDMLETGEISEEQAEVMDDWSNLCQSMGLKVLEIGSINN
jgi:hypothetical protein